MPKAASLTSVHTVDFSLQMYEMKQHIATKANEEGNLRCHLEGCRGTYSPYRINICGLRKPEINKKEGWQMVEQQVRNILRHLRDAHQIEEHPMVKAILPKGTPPFPELDELMALRVRVESLERDVGGLVGGVVVVGMVAILHQKIKSIRTMQWIEHQNNAMDRAPEHRNG